MRGRGKGFWKMRGTCPTCPQWELRPCVSRTSWKVRPKQFDRFPLAGCSIGYNPRPLHVNYLASQQTNKKLHFKYIFAKDHLCHFGSFLSRWCMFKFVFLISLVVVMLYKWAWQKDFFIYDWVIRTYGWDLDTSAPSTAQPLVPNDVNVSWPLWVHFSLAEVSGGVSSIFSTVLSITACCNAFWDCLRWNRISMYSDGQRWPCACAV